MFNRLLNQIMRCLLWEGTASAMVGVRHLMLVIIMARAIEIAYVDVSLHAMIERSLKL